MKYHWIVCLEETCKTLTNAEVSAISGPQKAVRLAILLLPGNNAIKLRFTEAR
jgi:hypothetical protein